ncbi:MAG TPA: hypothetical protein VM364_02180 [Vicinamibacterales bacterium]|nr:hypothetical protein [Vicinamibacterales bacterium]
MGGLLMLASLLARSWLPTLGPQGPALLVAMDEPLSKIAFGIGLAGCALTWARLSRNS